MIFFITGFLSIVVSRYAKHVFATDYDIKALEIAKLNQEVNFHVKNRLRLF
jgi:ribosomal protein L11 methylase PrmA